MTEKDKKVNYHRGAFREKNIKEHFYNLLNYSVYYNRYERRGKLVE